MVDKGIKDKTCIRARHTKKYLDLEITVMNVMVSEALGYRLSSIWKEPVYWF